MQIFLANGTLQHREVHYRVSHSPTPRVRTIPAGQQDVLPDDLEGEALNNVVRQLEALGAIPWNEVNEITFPNALLYRVQRKRSDAAIESDAIDEARARDTEARVELASQQMENAGLANFAAAQQNGPVMETTLEVTEVSDTAPVKDGVNYEVTVSQKPETNAGKKRTVDKPPPRRR